MPPPSCMVRRCAMSVPRKTRREIRDRYSSFCRKSESNRGMGLAPSGHQGGLPQVRQDVRDDVIGLHVLGLALEVEDQAVSQRRRGDGADVLAGDVIAVVEDGPQLGP